MTSLAESPHTKLPVASVRAVADADAIGVCTGGVVVDRKCWNIQGSAPGCDNLKIGSQRAAHVVDDRAFDNRHRGHIETARVTTASVKDLHRCNGGATYTRYKDIVIVVASRDVKHIADLIPDRLQTELMDVMTPPVAIKLNAARVPSEANDNVPPVTPFRLTVDLVTCRTDCTKASVAMQALVSVNGCVTALLALPVMLVVPLRVILFLCLPPWRYQALLRGRSRPFAASVQKPE